MLDKVKVIRYNNIYRNKGELTNGRINARTRQIY